MSTDTKIVIGVIIASVILLFGAVLFFSRPSDINTTQTNQVALLPSMVRDEQYNAKGAPQPIVTMVEFSDFQCPACKAYSPLFKQIISEFPNQIKLVYQHFPLPQHEFARSSAAAAEAAGIQNKFWEMHDLLFANQSDLSESKIEQLAKQISGLEIEKFKQDWKSDAVQAKLVADLKLVNELNLSSTPTLFINGVQFQDNMSLETLRTAVNQALTQAQLNGVGLVATSSAEATGSAEEKIEDSINVEVKK